MYRMMRFKGSNEKVSKMMMSHSIESEDKEVRHFTQSDPTLPPLIFQEPTQVLTWTSIPPNKREI